MRPPRTTAAPSARPSPRARGADLLGHRVGLRGKLLLLTLLPLGALVLLDVVGLLYVRTLHATDIERRVDLVEDLWLSRLQEVAALAERAARSLATSRLAESALRTNHWGEAREAVTAAAAADASLRALLIDDDGRILADSATTAVDEPTAADGVFAAALRGAPATGIVVEKDAWLVAWSAPVAGGGGIEGAAVVGVRLDDAFVRAFAARSRAVVFLVLPGHGVIASARAGATLASPGEDAVGGSEWALRLREVHGIGNGGAWGALRAYVGIDHGDLDDAVERQLFALGVTFLALVGVLLALTLPVAARLVRGIRGVLRGMAAVEDGRYVEAAEDAGADEVTALARGYNRMVQGLRERDFVRATFGRYSSPEVAHAILDDPGGRSLGGAVRVVSILMCDLRGFTAIAAELPPEAVVRMLNEWFGGMVPAVERYRGTINALPGDALLVLFGAPVAGSDDALRAVSCAIAMQVAMAGVCERLVGLALPKLRMGAGIATGPVVAGNIGTPDRLSYGVIGTAVNLASRLEGLSAGGDVLVDEATLAAAGAAGAEILVGPARDAHVKGTEGPLRVYAVLGVEGDEALTVPLADPSAGLRRVAADVRVWPLHEKRGSSEGFDFPLVAASLDALVIAADPPLEPWTDLRLQVFGAATTSDQIYGKVDGPPPAEFGPMATLVRLSRVPPADEALLATLEADDSRAAQRALLAPARQRDVP